MSIVKFLGLCYIEQKEFVHRAPAEPNTELWELEKYFIDEWHHPAECEANAQKSELLQLFKWHVGYGLWRAKSQDTVG